VKTEKVKEAINEAKRFIKKAELLIESRKEQRSYEYGGVKHFYDAPSGKESGATRRASLDLTRALAEMRKP
jgi:hypothetical protein